MTKNFDKNKAGARVRATIEINKRRRSLPLILWLLLLLLPGMSFAVGGKGIYNVRNFGARADGKSIDTKAISKAIEKAAENGGGTILFPAGKYLSFSIRLRSNISLRFDQGATLIAASEKKNAGSFDEPEPNVWGDSLEYQDFGHSHWHNSLIWGDSIENVSIYGPGTIWGKGLVRTSEVPKGGGNKAIALKNCHNIIIRDLTILHGGHFAILATGADNLTIDNLKIDTDRDAIDVDCCVNVRISNCTINSPVDDGICLKSSYALGYSRPTENVTITNCQVSGYNEGSLLDGTFKKDKPDPFNPGVPTGRIKLGTESNGGFKNITITNCVFDHCRGLALETVDGGFLEDVTISNITMRDILNAPIFLRLGARMRGPAGVPVGELRRVIISNVIVYNADLRHGVIVAGIPGHPISDVSFNNIRIYYKGGGTPEMAAIVPPEKETSYPEPRGMGEMPSYGFFIRHARNIELNDVQISTLSPDQRSPFVIDDVAGIDLFRIKATKEATVPVFRIQNSTNISLKDCKGLADQNISQAQQSNL